jgi:hypothetical protein
MENKSLYEAGDYLIRAIQQLLHDPHALNNIRQKLPKLARKFQEAQANSAYINKVKSKGKGWNHHNPHDRKTPPMP